MFKLAGQAIKLIRTALDLIAMDATGDDSHIYSDLRVNQPKLIDNDGVRRVTMREQLLSVKRYSDVLVVRPHHGQSLADLPGHSAISVAQDKTGRFLSR